MTACGNRNSSENETAVDNAPSAQTVTLNVTTTFAGEETNTGNYQEAIAKWQEETGNIINDASGTAVETFKARIISEFEMGSEPDVLFYFNGVDSNPFVEAGRVVSIDEIREVYPEYASVTLIMHSRQSGLEYAAFC